MLVRLSLWPTHPACPGPVRFPPRLVTQGRAWGHYSSHRPHPGPRPEAGHTQSLLGQPPGLSSPGPFLILAGAPNQSLQGQRWCGRDGQGGAPSLPQPWPCSVPRSNREQQVLQAWMGASPHPWWMDRLRRFLQPGPLALQTRLSACGGQGPRSPEGGSRPAPGSSRTSPALCGTPLWAVGPARRAAPPSEIGRAHV